MRRLMCMLVLSSFGVVDGALAQEQKPAASQRKDPVAPQTLKLGPLDVSINWRSRVELWDWFEAPSGNHDYAFFNSILRAGVGQSRPRLNWRVEVSQPTVLALPDDAVAAAPLGQLGLGGTYYAANSSRTNTGSLFLKQAFVQFNRLGRSTLKVGRFEFFDGTEAKLPDPTVATLVQGRVAHRLISNFGFTVAQRSFDGALFSWDDGANTLTGFAARPTAGVFQVDGMKELNVEIYHGAYNRAVQTDRGAGSFRTFVVGYVDRRTSVLKTDNRPAPVRATDHESISLATYGLNYVHVFDTEAAGKFDVVGWAVAQVGSWGTLTQRAGAFVGEVGWQPRAALKPWLRAGYSYGSGDGDPQDARNGTFFQLLTTPRQYARFPFYNMMNSEDVYGLFALRPNPKLTLRSELHGLWLASPSDLWYSGGGPFQPNTFGYAGRPSSGRTSLASVWDVGADTQLTPNVALSLYYGHAAGRDVIRGIYPNAPSGNFGYVESTVRF